MIFEKNNHTHTSSITRFLTLGRFSTVIIALVIIFTFSVGVRIYWASKQDVLYHDEYASIFFSNDEADSWQFTSTKPYNNVLNYNEAYTGKEIKLKYSYADSSLKDCISDIVSLYKNSKDPFISNLYYSFLRISFIGRVVYKVQDIIMTGTILNCIFFAISYIFMYKLLNLIFVGNRVVILFGILCISLLPSSISFAMFLRPYQMQETFFIVFIYVVFYILSNKNYSVKNFILLTLCTGLGYLTLTSSILFVLCTSLSIFLYTVIINKKEEINDRFKSKSEYLKSFFTYVKQCYIHIFIIIVSIFILFFAVIIPPGLVTRYGNLEIESINKGNNLKNINTKIKYKSKVFRDSDIYQVYDVKIISNYDTNEILEFRTTDIARVVLTTLDNFNEEKIKNIEVSYLLKPKMKKISQIITLSLLIPMLIIFLKKNTQNIKNNKKSLLYFSLSFITAFLVAQIFYASFFSNFINQNNRGANSLKFPFDFFNYLNSYAFVGFMIPIFIFLLSTLIIKIDKKNLHIKKLIPILIIFQALLWSISSDILSPFKLERYSIGSYPLLLIILPLSVALFLDNKKLRYIFMIIVSALYIQNAFTSKNLSYVEINTLNKDTFIYKQKTDIRVYGVENFLSIFGVHYLDDTQAYVLVKDYENLIEKIKTDNQDNFYVIFGNEDNHTKNQINIGGYQIVKYSSLNNYGEYNIIELERIK